MLIGKQEDDFLVFDAEFVVEDFQVVPEAVLAVSPAQRNLKYLTVSGERCQLRQRLQQQIR